MAFLPPVPVDAPVPRGKRYGLLIAANGPLDLPKGGSGGGVIYEPISCGVGHDYPVECAPDESPSESPSEFLKIFDEDEALITAEPFEVYATLQCGAAGRSPEEVERRVRLRLENSEQTEAERGFALTLAAAGAPQLLPPDPASIVDVVATLEQWVYGVQQVPTIVPATFAAGAEYGNIAYLHATPRAAAHMQAEHLLIKDGPVWRTAMGTIVVFGGGYSGALPGAAAAVDGTDAVYVTGQVTVWRSGVEVPSLRQTFDRGANQWLALAERTYAVAFDCVAAAAAWDYDGGTSP